MVNIHVYTNTQTALVLISTTQNHSANVIGFTQHHYSTPRPHHITPLLNTTASSHNTIAQHHGLITQHHYSTPRPHHITPYNKHNQST